MISAMAAATKKVGEAAQAIALPGCPDKCGNISIPYPFGTRDGCYFDPGFYISCNLSDTPPSAAVSGVIMKNGTGYYLANSNQAGEPPGVSNNDSHGYWILGLIDLDVAHGVARVDGPVSYDCGVNDTYHSIGVSTVSVSLSTAFALSSTRNALFGVGTNVEALLSGTISTDDIGGGGSGANYSAACAAMADTPPAARNGSCLGLGCCSAELSPGIDVFSVSMRRQSSSSGWKKTTPCTYAMVVDKSWYNFSAQDLYGHAFFDRMLAGDGVPLVLDFAIRNESCPAEGRPPPLGCRSSNSVCVNASQGPGYLCKCSDGYEGNPYLADGCQDIDECMLRDVHPDLRNTYPCFGICRNNIGGYDCQCELGTKGDAKNGTCKIVFPLIAMVATFGK
nr:unnamed protein product [Digitaria exilis]